MDEFRQTEAGSPEAGRGQPPEYSLTGEATRQEEITGGGVGTAPGPGEGMRRYPTEPPGRAPSGSQPSTALRWSALGGVVGAGAALLLTRLWRRR